MGGFSKHYFRTVLFGVYREKAKTELNWLSKLSLDEAVELTAEWYRGFKDGQDVIKLTSHQIDFYQSKENVTHARQ